MKAVRSLIYYIGMYLSIIVFFPFVVIGHFKPGNTGYYTWTQWAFFNRWWLNLTCRLSVNVQGIEHIDESKQYVIMPNHQSEWDTIVPQTFLPPFVFVLKKELFAIPIFGWGLKLSYAIGIDRSKGREALRQISSGSEKAFEKGFSVLIFPEGTRQPYGTLGRFLPGGAYLAHHSGNAVLPMAHNAGRFWPKNRFIKEPGVVELRIGAPIDVAGKSIRDIQQETIDAIQILIDAIDGDTSSQIPQD